MFKIVVQEEFWDDSLGIAIFLEKDGKKHVAKPIEIEFKEIKENELVKEPTIRLRNPLGKEFLQAVVNSARKQGIKPDENKLEGELTATKKHLEDMRILVFKNNEHK